MDGTIFETQNTFANSILGILQSPCDIYILHIKHTKNSPTVAFERKTWEIHYSLTYRLYLLLWLHYVLHFTISVQTCRFHEIGFSCSLREAHESRLSTFFLRSMAKSGKPSSSSPTNTNAEQKKYTNTCEYLPHHTWSRSRRCVAATDHMLPNNVKCVKTQRIE